MLVRTAAFSLSCAMAATLSLTCGCAPAAGDSSAGGPNLRGVDAPVVSKLTIPANRRQFDLVCHVTRQFDLREPVREDARPYRPPRRRDDHIRKIVDLETMQYCYPGTCGKRFTVANVTPEGVVFMAEPILTNFYRWDGSSESRFTYEGRMSIQQGQCRVEPFSGFGEPGPRPVYLREREGSGPHPLRHDGNHPDDEVVEGER